MMKSHLSDVHITLLDFHIALSDSSLHIIL